MKKVWIMALAVAALAACQQKDDATPVPAGPLTIEPVITRQLRSILRQETRSVLL